MPRRIVLIAGLAAGCGGGSAPVPAAQPAPASEECALRSGGAGGPALAGALVAAAIGADTALVSPARGRTPIGLSCTGRPVPRGAASWSTDSSRTAWTLVLPGAGETATRWRTDRAAEALRWAGVVSVIPLDDRRLVVTFRTPQATVPPVFAHPALAAEGESGDAELSPAAPADLRDALDEGAAVVVTADPAVLDYAAARPGLTRHGLPWNRTYVLLMAAGARPPLVIPSDTAGFRAALARDAVPAAARAAEPPFWWETTPGCGRPPAGMAPPAGGILYPAEDPVARALAERLVAIAGPGAVARGAPEAGLREAIARGAAQASVVSLPRLALLPCREIAGWPAGATALPLVDTRPSALVRDGTPPLAVDYDGGLLRRDRP
jgi:hypothetical protein